MNFWPPHSFYFITSTIFLSKKVFNSHDKKKIVLNQIKKAVNLLNVPIYAYSIAQNHYHVLLYFTDFKKRAKFKQIVNGGSAFLFNRYFLEYKRGPFWMDSKSLIIYDHDSLLRVIGYIAGNLLKHQEVKNFIELKATPFSNYKQLAKKYGDKEAERLVGEVIYLEENDNFLTNLKIQ